MQAYVFSLHECALVAAKALVKAEVELIDILQKLDSVKGYLQLGHGSLFEYATRALKLSESTAYSLISIARKSKQIPELKEQIGSGAITLSNARRIVPIINNNNKAEWLEKAKALPQRKLEFELARSFPKTETPEKMTFINAERVSLSLGISKEIMSKLKRVQDLECQRRKTHVTLENCLEQLVEMYLVKNDPLEKAKRVEQRKQGQLDQSQVEQLQEAQKNIQIKLKEKNIKFTSALVQPAKNFEEKSNRATCVNTANSFLRPVGNTKQEKVGLTTSEKTHEHTTIPGICCTSINTQKLGVSATVPVEGRGRTPLSSALKHHVWYRDQGQCTHRNVKGVRCESRRYLQIHHLKPVTHGGTNLAENLAVLCFAHHQMSHAY